MPTASLRYYKRFQMEFDLRRWRRPAGIVPPHYRLVPWGDQLVDDHAEVKFLSFRDELDSVVFPVLGELNGCRRLIEEIADRDGFVPEATWLAEYVVPRRPLDLYGDEGRPCGTIQAIRTAEKRACIQNIGVTPAHRGQGVGAALILASLWGLQQVGIQKAALEVTAGNESAVRLYRRLGFRTVKTVYKSMEDPTGRKTALAR